MDLKKINLKQIRDFSRTSPIYFSLGFTLLAILVNEIFSRLLRLLPDSVWMDILNELVFIIWPVALVLFFGFGFIFRQRGIRATVGAALFMYFDWVGLVYGLEEKSRRQKNLNENCRSKKLLISLLINSNKTIYETL